ncbi:unnamed protein product [Blepharisma stoltei]|uniref:non-specific serine/threonine protein kinase n=1 Tax=Blepharisma stoltei TaxID=1481888 RepID=A0AAU9J847_9CILI|nr:unnamed protein product [Blepharisma stoltei]
MEGLRQIKLLGQGAFGKCYLCENPKDNSKKVVKQINISSMSPEEKKQAYHEAKIMSSFDHPNIIRFVDVYTTTTGKLNIVMDYADGGDLQTKIKQQGTKYFTESQILDWFVQICLAMKHVHDRKILHRDIKSQNIFLMKNGMIKLGDFGIAKVLSSTIDNARTMVGTPYYLSPEIIESKPYNFKSDIWSLGVLLYELCALKPPFDGSSLHMLALKIVRGAFSQIPPHFSRDMRTLVSQMLSTDPAKRPTVAQVLRLPFIKSRIQNLLTETIRAQEFSHTVLHNQSAPILQGDPEIREVQVPAEPATEELISFERDTEFDTFAPTSPQVAPKAKAPSKSKSSEAAKSKAAKPAKKETPLAKQAITPAKKSKEEQKKAKLKEEYEKSKREEDKERSEKIRKERDEERKSMRADIKKKMKENKSTKKAGLVEWMGDPDVYERERMIERLQEACESEGVEEEPEDLNPPAPEIEIPDEEIVDREDELVNIGTVQVASKTEGSSTNNEVSMYNKLEEMRLELEQEMGADNFLQVYNILKEYVGQNEGDWDYGVCINRLRNILDTEKLKAYLPRVHQFQYLEKSADI